MENHPGLMGTSDYPSRGCFPYFGSFFLCFFLCSFFIVFCFIDQYPVLNCPCLAGRAFSSLLLLLATLIPPPHKVPLCYVFFPLGFFRFFHRFFRRTPPPLAPLCCPPPPATLGFLFEILLVGGRFCCPLKASAARWPKVSAPLRCFPCGIPQHPWHSWAPVGFLGRVPFPRPKGIATGLVRGSGCFPCPAGRHLLNPTPCSYFPSPHCPKTSRDIVASFPVTRRLFSYLLFPDFDFSLFASCNFWCGPPLPLVLRSCVPTPFACFFLRGPIFSHFGSKRC